MKVYTNNTFKGHWPVGTSAVVAADTPIQAAFILNTELINQGLIGNVEEDDMLEFKLDKYDVKILQDGEY